MATIITKNSSTASSVPTNAQLVQGELAVNVTDKRLFTENASGTVVELGTNPSSLTLPNGTANGLAFLNASKVLTTGSALTFDGTTFANTNTIKSITEGAAINATNSGLVAQRSTNDSQLYIGYRTTPDAWVIGATYSSTGAYKPIAFAVNDSEQMRLTSTGLGIGTSSPGAKVDVRGASTDIGLRYIETTTGNSNRIQIGAVSGAGYVDVTAGVGLPSLQLRTNGTTQATLDASGNLGLGVTPSAWGSNFKATQVGAYGALFNWSGGVSGVANNAYHNGTNWTYQTSAYANTYEQSTAGGHRWYTAPSGTAGAAISFTQAMTLDASGNLLVGTTNSGYNNRIVVQAASGAAAGRFIVPSTAGSDVIYFMNPNGVVGSIVTNGTSTAYNTSSDYRLKDNIAPMTGALAKVAALKPCTYKWKTDGSDGEGFIAHELAEVVPQCVTGEKDAVDAEGKPVYQGIDTSFLVATLTAAIQELKVSLDEVKLEFDAYKAAHL